MDQQDHGSSPETPSGVSPSPAPSTKMRTIAVAATAIALIGISIPFVWQPHVDATPASTTASVTPAASHDPSPGASCMADAKPANWDFKLKDMDGKEVLLSSFKDPNKVVLLNFWGIPASFIISKDGRVCRKHMGIAPKAVFEKEIVALM